ncbi:OB-fold-containig protein [Kluyvera sichuanensis]|uniref:OB-fold-containig protein n=1 Tax=Kluyvera sichuanensis TaxID=2725494 RepID=UPI0039F707A7
MILLTEYNSPYLFALAFVLLIGVLEIISLAFGHYLSGALDAHLDNYDALSSGNIGQVLHFLNIGRIPLLVVLCLLAGFFGLFGILFQHGWVMLLGAPLSNLLLTPACFIISLFAVHYSGKIIAPWLPRDESSALAEDDYIGYMAIITGHSAIAGTPCEGKFTDKFGQTHYLLLEPEEGYAFKKGDKVLILDRLSATRYLAERNPWPNIL